VPTPSPPCRLKKGDHKIRRFRSVDELNLRAVEGVGNAAVHDSVRALGKVAISIDLETISIQAESIVIRCE
jgi:hypothetical protein